MIALVEVVLASPLARLTGGTPEQRLAVMMLRAIMLRGMVGGRA